MAAQSAKSSKPLFGPSLETPTGTIPNSPDYPLYGLREISFRIQIPRTPLLYNLRYRTYPQTSEQHGRTSTGCGNTPTGSSLSEQHMKREPSPSGRRVYFQPEPRILREKSPRRLQVWWSRKERPVWTIPSAWRRLAKKGQTGQTDPCDQRAAKIHHSFDLCNPGLTSGPNRVPIRREH